MFIAGINRKHETPGYDQYLFDTSNEATAYLLGRAIGHRIDNEGDREFIRDKLMTRLAFNDDSTLSIEFEDETWYIEPVEGT